MTAPEGAQGGATGTPSGAEGTPGAGAPATEPTGQSTGTATTAPVTEPEPTVARKDFDAIRAQLSAADQKRQAAEDKLKQLVDKDLPEMDRLKRDNAELAKKAEEAAKALEQTRIENAFLTHADDKINWQNPATALRLLDRSKITIDSEGNVIGMKDAIEALAKSDAYLLKPKESTEPDEPPVGGTLTGNNGKGGTAGLDKNKMAARFPVVRTRH